MELDNSIVKTPEAETETPTKLQPAKPSPFTNGVLKRHAPLHLHHPVVVIYKECLKNHAASIGGHAVDGCGEFMPSPTSNPAEPATLKCAACGCHRNFHRREPDEPPRLPPPSAAPALEYQPHHRHHPPPPPRGNSGSSPNNSPSPPPISSSYYPSAPHMLLALSHGFSGPPPESNIPVSSTINAASTPMLSSSHRKRFRTKFSQNQKDRMLEFAERIGWKMQKRDEDEISEFCTEIGVDRGVFKVWMHNNKNTVGKKDQPPHLSNNTTGLSAPLQDASTNGNGIDYDDIGAAGYPHQHEGRSDVKHGVHGQEMSQLHNNTSSASAFGTNGSSST